MFLLRMQLIHNDLNARILSPTRVRACVCAYTRLQKIKAVIYVESALNPAIGISLECAGRWKPGVVEKTCHSPSEEVVGGLCLPAAFVSIFSDIISEPAIT